MMLESISGVHLHCSRCNTIFQDPESETDAYWRDADDVRESFADLGDCCGWRKFGDRIVCKECQATDADGDPCERPDPLPPGEEDRVLRTQMRYKLEASPANPFRYVGMSMPAILQLLDDVRQRIADGDSFEGFIEYVIPEKPTQTRVFDVRAGYRIGNSLGQGGFRLIEGPDEQDEDEVA